eukprot:2423726-Pleurochrysis_carterae.AAC.1
MNRRQRNQAASSSMNAPSRPSTTRTAHTSSSLPAAPEPLDSASTIQSLTGAACFSTGSGWLPAPAQQLRTVGALGSHGTVRGSAHGGHGTLPLAPGRGRG